MADMSHHITHNAGGFQPRADAPHQQQPHGTHDDLVVRREAQLNGAVRMPAPRSEMAIDDGFVPPHRVGPTNRNLMTPDLHLDKLKKLSPVNRSRAPANPFQSAAGSTQYRQLALLQSIDDSLRRLRQMAEAGRQLPATFTPPEF